MTVHSANVRFAPEPDVPEKSAFDLDRAKTSSEGRRSGGQIQGLSQAAIAEIKRFDPDGVHDGIQFGRLETLRFAFF
jgi:hypothetical protein